MGGTSERFKQWWLRTDRTQRLVTLGGIGMLLLILAAGFVFMTRPRLEPLFSHLSEQEQGTIASDLEGMGFHPNVDRIGVIEIPAEEKAAARMKLASANKLPKAAGGWGNDELKTSGLGETPSIEQERLKAIREGEIARSIEQMDGIDSARVHLTIPAQTAFADEQKPATASIALVESGTGLNGGQGRAIAILVKNAVAGLDEKDIVVVNQHMQMIYNGQDDASNVAGGAQHKTEIDNEVSKQRAREIQNALDTAFGPGSTIVTVHADVDMDRSDTESNETTPSDHPEEVTQQTEKVSGNGRPGASGTAGVNGNLNPTAGNGASAAGSYSGNTATKKFPTTEVHTTTAKAMGAIKAMVVNVVVDSTRVPDPTVVEKYIQGDLGDKIKINPQTGKPELNQPFSYSVTSFEFDKTAAKEALAASSAATRNAQIQQILSMLPIGALMLVAAVVLKQITKFTKNHVLAPAETSNASGLPSSGVAALPDGNLSALLAQIESNTGTGAPGETPIRYNSSPGIPIEVEDIKSKVHIPLEQLKRMAQEKPQVVAMLIKSMILEERK